MSSRPVDAAHPSAQVEPGDSDERVYKLLLPEEWEARQGESVPRAPVDRRDGFVHLSAAAQVRETARLHFAAAERLVLLEVSAAALGAQLRWEPSRGGLLFPHCYGDVPLAAVRSVVEITGTGDERRFPSHLP